MDIEPNISTTKQQSVPPQAHPKWMKQYAYFIRGCYLAAFIYGIFLSVQFAFFLFAGLAFGYTTTKLTILIVIILLVYFIYFALLILILTKLLNRIPKGSFKGLSLYTFGVLLMPVMLLLSPLFGYIADKNKVDEEQIEREGWAEEFRQRGGEQEIADIKAKITDLQNYKNLQYNPNDDPIQQGCLFNEYDLSEATYNVYAYCMSSCLGDDPSYLCPFERRYGDSIMYHEEKLEFKITVLEARPRQWDIYGAESTPDRLLDFFYNALISVVLLFLHYPLIRYFHRRKKTFNELK